MQFAGRKLRHELKYYIHHHEYIGLRDRVGAVLTMDKHSLNREGYHIRSLYFDNVTESALYDKNNGVFQRKKYRIRVYNKCDQLINLERKSKYQDFIAKDSARLTRAQYDRLLGGDYEFLKAADVPLLHDFYIALKHGAMKPAVVVDYMREAYIYPASDLRITFDKQLSASVQSFQIFDRDLVTMEPIQGPKTILEVKYNQFLPSFVHRLMQMSALHRSTISKYGICKENQKIYA